MSKRNLLVQLEENDDFRNENEEEEPLKLLPQYCEKQGIGRVVLIVK
jgi:hypothetical protein